MKKKLILGVIATSIGVGIFTIGNFIGATIVKEKNLTKEQIVYDEEDIRKDEDNEVNYINEIEVKNNDSEKKEKIKNEEEKESNQKKDVEKVNNSEKKEIVEKDDEFTQDLKPLVKCNKGHSIYLKDIPIEAIPVKYLNGETVEFTHESSCEKIEELEKEEFGGLLDCGVCIKNSEYVIDCPNPDHSKMAEGYGE